MSVEISNSSIHSDSFSLSALQSPSSRLVLCATPVSTQSPAKSTRLARSGPDMSFSDMTSPRRSPLSIKCSESITKSRRVSLQCSSIGESTDFSEQSQYSTLLQSIEECESRHNKTEKSVKELTSTKTNEKHALQLIKDSERASEIADQVLTAYGIQARVYTVHASDSAMIIMPITQQRKLANFYRLFIPEMRRFNYLFLSNLRIGTISICESVQLTKQKHSAILHKKLCNGLFVIDRLQDRRSVQQHWYKIVLYHFLKAVPEFYEEWRDLIMEDPRLGKKSSPFEELLATFNHLMGTSQELWQQDIYMKTRANFLKEALRKFDLRPIEKAEVEANCHDILRLLSLVK